MAQATLEATRHEWEAANRRFEAAARDRQLDDRFHADLDVVLAELRKRVGQTFTLDELAAAYGGADRWVQEAVAESEPAPGWPGRLTVVQGAAFHRYSRGAVNYRP